MVRACAVHASRHGDTHRAAGARAVRAGRGARRRHRALDRRRPRGTGRHRGEPAHVRRVPGGAARRRAGDADRRSAAAAARRARRDRGRQRHRPGAHRFRLRLTSRPRPPTPRRCGGCARQTRCGRRRPRPSALHRGPSYTWSWTVLARAERERPGGRSHLRRCHGRTHGDVDDSGVPLGAQLMGPPNPSRCRSPWPRSRSGTGLGARPAHPVVVTGSLSRAGRPSPRARCRYRPGTRRPAHAATSPGTAAAPSGRPTR